MTDQSKSSSAIARLLELSGQSDIQAMDSLYRVVSPQLYGNLMSMLKNEDLAAQALQLTFADIWSNSAGYRSDLGSPMAWLNHVARGHAVILLREQRIKSGSNWDAQDIPSVSLPKKNPKVAGLRTLGLDNDGAVAGVGSDVQAMVKGAFLQGASTDELALHFGITANQVKSQLRGWLLGMREQING